MSSEEYLNLVKEFERVYDPYGSYVAEDLSLMNSADLTDENGTVSSQWKSGNIDASEMHRAIIMFAVVSVEKKPLSLFSTVQAIAEIYS